MALERLQKLLARAGFGSRRACEEMITGGRVAVGGQIVSELGARADLETQDVRLDGQRIRAEHPEYWILNKPKGVVCTNLDPAGRRRPIDLMTGSKARLFAVGRLDVDAKGLLLMTNDGEFANRLTHPRYEVPKTYVATAAGDLTKGDMGRLIRSVWLAEGRTKRAEVRLLKHGRARSIVEVTLREGRHHQIRRFLAKLGHNIRELVRTRIGRISLKGLGVGQSRRLSPDEVEYLRKLPDEPPPVRVRPHEAVAARPARPAAEHGPDVRAARQAGRGARPPWQERRKPRPVPRERQWRREPGPEERGALGGAEPPHPFMKGAREIRREGRPGDRRGDRPQDRRGGSREGRRERRPGGRQRDRRGDRPEGRPGGTSRRGETGRSGLPPTESGGHREKRSPWKHDPGGTGQAGQGDRRHADRRGGGRRDRRGGPPGRGRRPHRHPPQ
jgi:23S rRNA pseudouridine2605 synthase